MKHVKAALMRLIEARIKGRDVTFTSEAEKQPIEAVDLIERLRTSLEQAGGTAGRARGRQRLRAKLPVCARKKHAA